MEMMLRKQRTMGALIPVPLAWRMVFKSDLVFNFETLKRKMLIQERFDSSGVVWHIDGWQIS